MSRGQNPFKNLDIVAQSLNRLLRLIPASDIVTKWPTFEKPLTGAPSAKEKTLYVQWLSRAIARHYGIMDTTFIVLINPRLEAAATVEVRSAKEIFVEFRETETIYSAAVTATLAHEIAHIFLHRKCLELTDSFENEILTDTTTVFLGFGRDYLRAQKTTTEWLSNGASQTTTHRYGYLTPEEMGYVLAIRDRLRNEPSAETIKTDMGRAGFKAGTGRLMTELKRRPYSRRSLVSRAMLRLGWMRLDEGKNIEFPCWICKQQLRIPILRKKLIATCPNCHALLPCYS